MIGYTPAGRLPVETPEVLPYAVRRGRQIIANFAQRSDAGNWAREYSNIRDTKSTFIVHFGNDVLNVYRDGEEVEL
jgi:hypothetical protein